MVSDQNARWPHYHPEIPKRMGNIYDIDKFDAQFFGVHLKQAESVDPQGRLLQERAYEAIVDAGINPRSLRGSRTGVFIGACFGESEKTWFYEKICDRGFGITGCSRSMLANRVSYALGFHGPSLVLDTACSSSMYALDIAFSHIRSGQCDAAIVGGSNLLLEPGISLNGARLGILATDGYCRPFDKNASGFTRAEAVVAIFLQKAKHSKRIYANLVYTKTNCDGHKEQGITFPSGQVQQNLLTEFYSDLGVDTGSIRYVEAHGTGTHVGDPEECSALDTVLCQNRKEALLVGSVKSNMGHSESSSGVCSITKVALALDRGEVPPNINYDTIHPGISSIAENRIKVCTEVTQLPENALVGINSFGFGGGNAHALLRGNRKAKENGGWPNDDIPRLVNWSGRTEETISLMFDHLRSAPLDAEYIGLLHNIQSVEESRFLNRGFGIFAKGQSNTEPAVCLRSGEQRYDGAKRPMIWIFSGIGSQWNEMGSSMMVLPLFKESIDKSHLILKPYGIDLLRIITDPDIRIFENVINSVVGIAAIQIAFVDVLRELNIQPDYIIGHSVGELGCAYADGALTQEQTMLLAYYRGVACDSVSSARGSMAAVGMAHGDLKQMLPADIDVACHNSAVSTTISGPEKSIETFVDHLSSQNIFARVVNSSNIAFHSRYIVAIGRKLLELTKGLFASVERSDKWLSTSVPQSEWDKPQNRVCNAEYFVNNLLSSVLFEETCALLPANGIAVEIAPHGLMQAIVKRSMPTTIHIPLAQRGNSKNVELFLTALGNLYLNGWSMPLEKLYPPINYPVSRGTAKISHLLRWDHSVSLFVSKFELNKGADGSGERFKINLAKEEFAYMAGHKVDVRCVIPFTAYLELVWKTLAKLANTDHEFLNVEFEKVQFHAIIALQSEADVELTVMIHPGNGTFEVAEGSTSIMTGVVREVNVTDAVLTKLPPSVSSTYPTLNQEDFYKEMRLRGYNYQGDFQSITNARSDGANGKIRWNQNWAAFMMCMYQTVMLSKDTRTLLVPDRIQRVRIFPREHFQRDRDIENEDFAVNFNKPLNTVQSGGIEFVGLVTKAGPHRKNAEILVLESYKFLPHNTMPVLSQKEAYRVCLQLLIENNSNLTNFNMLEVQSLGAEFVVTLLEEILVETPTITANLTLLTNASVELPNVNVENETLSTQSNCHLIVLSDVLVETSLLEECQKCLVDQGFVIVRKPLGIDWSTFDLNLIAEIPLEHETLLLLRKRPIHNTNFQVIDVSESTEFNWVDEIRESAQTAPLLLVSQGNQFSGVLGLTLCLLREPDIKSVSCVFIDDESAPPFDPSNPFYGDHLSLNLVINVYKNGSWGSFRHLTLVQETEPKSRADHHFVNALRPGDVSSLSWLHGPLNHRTNDQLVRVHYAAINFRDVVFATGIFSSDVLNLSRVDKEQVLGVEYAGTTLQGQRVMGMVASGSIATLVQPNGPLTWSVPRNWSLQEAATVPIVYYTVYCAFFMGKAISAGKTILIHTGSGGIGLAAIRVALAYGMEVFTTVSNNTKRKYILDLFPTLKECNIGNSRDCSFEQMIKLRTDGQGVDYVLNTLSDEKVHASVRCLGWAGVFLEIGKFNIFHNIKIGLGEFAKQLSFRSVLDDNLFLRDPQETSYIHGLIERDLQNGIIRPLESTVFQVDEIEKACRFLGSGRHIGKVLIQVRRNGDDERSVPIGSVPRAIFHADKVYVVPGGLGGLGLELADWMILRGARKIVLTSRHGVSTSYQAYRIRIWENYGCRTIISTADIGTAAGCQALIDEAQQYGEIDGIFNLAACVRDGLLENQSAQSFKDSAQPKPVATAFLDAITRKQCRNITYFVMFSSYSCGRGNAGQSSYGQVNSMAERIMERRVADGFSGKAIQWAAIADVGLAATMFANTVDPVLNGTGLQRIFSCLNVIDALLTAPDAIVASMVVGKKNDLTVTLAKNVSLIEMVLNIMGITDSSTLSMNTSLADLGVDSLMIIEMKQALEREFEVCVSIKDLRGMTIGALKTLSDENSVDNSDTGSEKKDGIDSKEGVSNGEEELDESVSRKEAQGIRAPFRTVDNKMRG